MCFFSLLMESDRDFMRAINNNLPDIVSRYANKHTVENFKGRTAFVCDSGSDDESPESKNGESAVS